jgi:hypothetical protein
LGGHNRENIADRRNYRYYLILNAEPYFLGLVGCSAEGVAKPHHFFVAVVTALTPN